MKKSPIIELKNITKIYSGEQNITALEKISFNVYEGEFVTILGPNGCGKTTLIEIMANISKPTSGEIKFNRELSCAIIFQEYNKSLFNWLTVFQNIGFGLHKIKASEKEKRKIINKFIHLLKLNGFENSYPSELSGGMQQKVAIARTLAYNPNILFMDEPFGSLDFDSHLNLRRELVQIWKLTNKTIVFVTHNIEEAIFLSNRIIVLTKRPGKVKKIIDVKLAYPRNSKTYLDPKFLLLKREIQNIMREEEL